MLYVCVCVCVCIYACVLCILYVCLWMHVHVWMGSLYNEQFCNSRMKPVNQDTCIIHTRILYPNGALSYKLTWIPW